MTDYEKYVQLLKQQYAEIKTDAHLAEIRQMLDSHRETLVYFRFAKQETETRFAQKQQAGENLAEFVSDVKTRLGGLAHLKELLYALIRFENISDQLKHTIRQLEEYCMNNLSLDDILKASAGAENLKQQAEQQENAVEKIQSAYLVHQGLISFFAGVNRQFQSMMQTATVNAKTADAFLALFEQHIPELSGLKFQIGRTKTGHAEVENLLKYCREEMTLYELQHCTEELKITVQQAEQQRLAEEAERKRQEELRRQEEDRRRREEMKRQEEERKRIEEEQRRQEELRKQEERKKKGIYTNSLGMTFWLIPAGTFMMGSPEEEEGRSSDEVLHRVTISKSFYMQTTQVTQGQWQAVMGDNPSDFTNCGENCPVENVSWDDTVKFIDKLNQADGKNRYRLPTEAEWEYACRAGSNVAYCFGNDIWELDRFAWYDGNSGGETHPVGQLEPNAWGLYDMHGNVWEWCSDWYGNYPSGAVTDPAGSSTGSSRVYRGGGWFSLAVYCRSAPRRNYSPDLPGLILGFRLFLSPGQQ